MFILNRYLAFLDIGGTEIMMVMLVMLLLFGSRRLPELARNLGKSMREIRKATSGLEEELRRALEAPPPPPPPRKSAAAAAPDAFAKTPATPPTEPPRESEPDHHP